MPLPLALLALLLFASVHFSPELVGSVRQMAVSSLFPFWTKMGAARSYWLGRPFFHRTQPLLAAAPLEKKKRGGGKTPVLCRDPSAWSSVFWIGAGEGEVEKNTPVLYEGALVGVVETVGKKTSQVRLITDPACHIAVQVARGQSRDRHILGLLEQLETLLSFREELFLSPEEKEFSLGQFSLLRERLKREKGEQYLARGELFGSGEPLWRAKRQVLQGVGFFMGEEAELKSDVPFLQEESPIVKEGDLLVTSGLDGVFPPGIPVAYVRKVAPQQEGDFCYSLSAIPAVFDLNKIQEVDVLLDPQ